MRIVGTEREDLEFASGGERCAAWLYRPEGKGPHPCVVLGHGLAGTRAGRLWAYAERFRDAGIAALAFDYRHFGDSAGEPRQLLSIGRQHEDWRAAIAFAGSLEGIDPARIALWGTSFAGGHVVKVGAEDGRLAAVVAQTPFTDGPSALREVSPFNVVRLTVAGLRDGVRALAGREPYRIPVVARPGELGAMTQPGSYDGYFNLYRDRAEFRNELCGRVALRLGAYMPARAADRVHCPLLVVTVAGDRVTPPEPARRMAARAPRGRNIDYSGPYGHFDIYVGDLFERTIVEQTAFLAEHLEVPAPASATQPSHSPDT